MLHALTLGLLVEQACDQFAPGDSPTRYYTAAAHHAAAFRRELIAGTSRYITTAFLDLGDDRSVNLPNGYVEYTMLGLLLPGWTQARNLVYNANLPLLESGAGAVSWSPDDEAIDFLTPPTYEETQAKYGGDDGYCGYGNPAYGGEFRIDRQTNRIICNSRVPSDALLVLEYYTFDAPDGEDIPIDALAHSWGINFILSKLHLQKKDLAMSREFERFAGIEREKYKARIRNFSLAGVRKANHEAAAQDWK